MVAKKQFITLAVISILVISGIAATRMPVNKARNLKVLPADISDNMLDSIMNAYNKSLGVGCDFCHSNAKPSPFLGAKTDGLDYASDDKHMKEEARKMMRLTIQLNKDYFYYDSLQRPEYLKVVTCYTCHRGDPFPADLK
jgi:Photosynthetic reaction centre cytochrome C subunit